MRVVGVSDEVGDGSAGIPEVCCCPLKLSATVPAAEMSPEFAAQSGCKLLRLRLEASLPRFRKPLLERESDSHGFPRLAVAIRRGC
jgi:hypothetical protein